MKMYTPWGLADYEKPMGESGIIAVSTSSHGGYYVPPELYNAMPEPLRFNPYGGGTWFEEDCEWALVALAYPQHFEARDLHYAVLTMLAYADPKECYHRAYRWLTETETGKALVAKYKDWKEEAA